MKNKILNKLKRPLMWIKLKWVVWQALHKHQINSAHLLADWWRPSGGTALTPILKKEVLMWYKPGQDQWEQFTVLYIQGEGDVTRKIGNNDYCFDSNWQYKFSKDPVVIYDAVQTSIILKIVALQKKWKLKLKFKFLQYEK